MSVKNPYLDFDQKIVGDIYTSRETMDNLEVLCDEFGSRFGGTEGEYKSVEFFKTKMLEYGLSNVHAEPVNYVGWKRGKAHLEIVSPIQKEIPCISLPHSPAAEMEGEIIDMGDGAPADFDRRAAEIDGKVVMASSVTSPKSSERWIHRREKYGRSVMAGAKAFIFVNHYPGYGPATGGIGGGAQGPIPGIGIGMEEGAFIQRLLRKNGAVRIRFSSTDVCEPMVAWNVIGELPGRTNQDRIVMMGSHYDGHDISQGAEDPASGAAAVLEAARVLAKYARELDSTVRFALWAVEEIGLIGSKAYVKDHEAEMDHIRFYLNMDAAGASSSKRDIILNEWSGLEPLFSEWRDEMALDFAVGQSVHAFSDHYPFLLQGVPTGGLGTAAKTNHGRGYGHTRFDTVDKVQLLGMRQAACRAARLAVRIANEKDWPAARRTQEQVQELLNTPAYQEEKTFRDRYEKYLHPEQE